MAILCIAILISSLIPLGIIKTIWAWISLDMDILSNVPRIGIVIIWLCLIPLYFIILYALKDILFFSRPGFKHLLVQKIKFKDLKEIILDSVKEYESIEISNRIEESEDSVREILFASPILEIRIEDVKLKLLVKKSPHTPKRSFTTKIVWRIIIGKIKEENKKESRKIEKILTKKLQKYIIN